MVISSSPMQISLTQPRLVDRNRAAATEKIVQNRAVSTPTNRLFQRLVRYWLHTAR